MHALSECYDPEIVFVIVARGECYDPEIVFVVVVALTKCYEFPGNS